MAKKQTKAVDPAAEAEIGDMPGIVQFEPCAAPLTKGKGTPADTSRATHTLKHTDGRTFVYGVKDCQEFGEGRPRRLNSFDRYADGDYLDLLKVAWLKLFASHRGNGEAIAPTGVLSVPIAVYNDDKALKAYKAGIVGDHQFADQDGCILKLTLDEKRLVVMPESAGSVQHFLFDHKTLKARGGEYDVSGNVVCVDVGFLTANFSLHISGKYQRQTDVSFTEPNMGMGTVVNRVLASLTGATGQEYDISELDRNLRAISNIDIGEPKRIKVNRDATADVAAAYDPAITDLARAIADVIRNRYKIPINLIILTGGATSHLASLLSKLLGVKVKECPNAHLGNLLGGWTLLRLQFKEPGISAPLLWASDVGNGGVKAVSSETMR